MRNETIARPFALDWLRVGAMSGSFAAHAVILLLVALPVTVPVMRPVAHEIVARWIEPPPAPETFPEPPPPKAEPHHVVRATPPAHVEAPPTPMSVPENPSPPTEIHDASPPTGDGPATAPPDIGSGGATQALAYASPMQPRYPPASVRAREEGVVTLRVLVDAGGVPQRVEIAKSSGHVRLDASAKESVERARFRPVMRNGVAVQAWGIVPIAFRLERG
ncbi:MAG TPA: energy transducer TonB [Rhodanobacteraceae bacterium]|nr:energy transducer TonB [Rhodanobacteraceae bacterium]